MVLRTDVEHMEVQRAAAAAAGRNLAWYNQVCPAQENAGLW